VHSATIPLPAVSILYNIKQSSSTSFVLFKKMGGAVLTGAQNHFTSQTLLVSEHLSW